MSNYDPCSTDKPGLLSLTQAAQTIYANLQPLTAVTHEPLKAALGRILAADVTNPADLPRDRNAAMDGYAFHSTDLPAGVPRTLTQVGIAWAGKPFGGTVKRGECVRIFTGAVLPPSTDSVIMQEQVQVDGINIHLPATARGQQCVRQAGEDLRAGARLLAAGKKLSAADLGLLAAAGLPTVTVTRPLKVAYFSTGDELVPLGQPLACGQLYDSNRYILHGLLNDPCYHSCDLGTVADSPEQLEALLRSNAPQFDVILSTGGASVGDADHIQPVLSRCGEVKLWKIAIKPGKPLAFGKIEACYFFGLPGNPVAAITTFQQLVAPALHRLCGGTLAQRWRFPATSLENLKKSPGRLEFQRGILSQSEQGAFTVRPAGAQGSHLLGAFSQANCYILLAAECRGIQAGEQVTVEPF